MRPLPSPPLPFPARSADAHKGNLGRVLLLGGSRGMAGSIALSAMAALKTGSGLVSAAVPDRCLETVAHFHPGVMTIPMSEDDQGRFARTATIPNRHVYDAIGMGPGMGTGVGSIRLVEELLSRDRMPRVLDADAINVLAEHPLLESASTPEDQSNLVITPHPGELARWTGVAPSDRGGQIEASQRMADRFGMTIVIKGAPTVVVSCGAYYPNETGNAGMATAGSGDVLTGVVTSLLGRGLSAWNAACLGVFLHGLAGDLAAESVGAEGMTCREILEQLPAAIRRIAAV